MNEAVLVPAGADLVGAQGVRISERVSAATVGAGRLCGFFAELGPGEHTAVHHHDGEETIVLLTAGSCDVFSGKALTHRVHMRVGDVVFIPSGCVHRVEAGPEGFTVFEVRSGHVDRTVVLTP
ncbi:cupin domain-containing protein [Embleya sp. NBC_00896]|uniref:cupin domain-containing protein n=1 Tax=Embleya sp. NBC_00896 TaxID=2975961 RepID=UPI002F9078C8|nr:cupin domain-containing protein [Embleya sp. NBC_00896]